LPSSSDGLIAALARLNVRELWGSASQRAEQAAVALLGDNAVVVNIEAAALVNGSLLAHENSLNDISCFSNICGHIVRSTDSLIEGFNSGNISCWAIASKVA
jgi:hypothetical protein